MAKQWNRVTTGPTHYFNNLNYLGFITGMLFIYAGFLPSLLPRGWVLQGVLSGILFAFGYASGLIVSHFVRKFKPHEPPLDKKRTVKRYTFFVLAGLYLAAVIVGFNWQQQVRELVGQPPATSASIISTVLVTIILVVVILLIARSIRSLYWWLRKLVNKYIPKPIAYTAAWLITTLLVIGILNGVIISRVMDALNEAYRLTNGKTEEGIVQPKDSHLSGSSQSLIKWDTLGQQGRTFIGEAPTSRQLTDFNETEAAQPIRIYAGLESAGDTAGRAALAVDDLKRAGGFDREIIVVVTTTGTGWVDEEGVKPVEYMYNGDTAVISQQYSYLPSSLSFLVDKQKAKDAGNELYNAVYDAVLDIPEANRPKIVVFGESLGSYGGEAAFANEAAFKATSDGVVWAGPPNFNELRKTATQKRDAGSPEILPVFQGGENLRFANRADDFKNPDEPWHFPRAAYLENASDPIVWWSPRLVFEKPDWLDEKRGADVSPATRWLPLITFFQVSGDMVFSTNVPDGHGHNYGTFPTDAWGYVAAPEGWTAQKTEALKTEFGD